jgi:uncharacterized delta-60 repeat protein
MWVVLNTNALAQPELDITFNSTGKVVLNLLERAGAYDVAVQPDNKIIMVSGCSKSGVGNVPICVVRLNEDGSLDTTFGAGAPGNLGEPGSVLTKFNVGGDETGRGVGIALQSDGKIVAVGTQVTSGANATAMVRYNADGSLDTTFGTGGKVYANVASGHISESTRTLAIQPDGKIVVTGSWIRIQNNPTWNYWVRYTARFLPNGTVDTTFGTGGVVTDHTPSFLSNTSGALAIQPDGKILVGGSLWRDAVNNNPFWDSELIRLNADGSTDNTWSVVRVANTTGGFSRVLVQPDGRILAVTTVTTTGGTPKLLRLLPDGTPDTTFDSDGVRTVFRGNQVPLSMVLAPDGKISVVGMSMTGSDGGPDYPYLVERFLPDGSPDATFGDNGYLKVFLSNTRDGGRAGALDQLGRLVVAGATTVTTDFQNAKFSAIRLTAPPITPSEVTVIGRVMSADGLPLSGLTVRMSDGVGGFKNARTNPFGYYQFTGVMSNQHYSVAIKSRAVSIAERSIFVGGPASNFDFTAAPLTASKGDLDLRALPVRAESPTSQKISSQ